MKAIVYDRYGPPEVLHAAELPKPAPKDGEVLIRVHATTVSTADLRIRSLDMPAGFGLMGPLAFGIGKPRQPVLGTELAGVIEAVGKDVTTFKPGDRVFAFPGGALGSYAEYRTMPADGKVVLAPRNIPLEQAAALSFGGSTALHFLREGKVKAGDRVLVNGASGAVGVALVQLARHLGASVTGVCSGANADLVRSLGASRIIDYTKGDIFADGSTYDVIADTVGTLPLSKARRGLVKGGRLLVVLGTLGELLRAPFAPLLGVTSIAGPATERVEDLRTLAQLTESGAYRPVIDRTYPLEEIVDAHRYADTGRKRGSVLVTI
jgi:NADPH:quinone reductase-like Zn-dependent oxidoreductase